MKRSTKAMLLVLTVVVGMSISGLSASTVPAASHALPVAAQKAVTGGLSCDAALGLGAGLAIGALTPCSIICAVGAWYDLALIAYAC